MISLEHVAARAMLKLDELGVCGDYSISSPSHLNGKKLDVMTDDITVTIFESPTLNAVDAFIDRLEYLHRNN